MKKMGEKKRKQQQREGRKKKRGIHLGGHCPFEKGDFSKGKKRKKKSHGS